MIIRAATLDDIAAIADIYAHYVLHSVATFEETPPSLEDMTQRFTAIKESGLPYIVGENHGMIIGYAYAGIYKARSAYRFTVENSIYLRPDYVGQGHGKALLQHLMMDCAALGLKQMLAVISGDTPASVMLHKKLGFSHAGLLPSVGYKFDRWLDVTIMSRALS
jgi:L-amino acid N-acyltransferase YncA